jgi:hypothetical protein
MALLPATGTEITMGKVRKGFSNANPAASQNITLSGTLGPYKGKTPGTAISLSSTFGGATTPYVF